MATDTISKPVPNSSYDVARRNLEDTDKLVNNTSGAVTNRSGKTMRPLPVLVNELESLIAGSGTRLTQIPSVDVLRTVEGEFDGQAVYLVSYYAGANKGGGVFVWDAASTAADDGGVTIAVTSVATGRWVRESTNGIIADHFGAVNDGSVSFSPLADNYINYCQANKIPIKFGSGIYRLSASHTLDGSVPLVGEGSMSTEFRLLNHSGGAFVFDTQATRTATTGVSGVKFLFEYTTTRTDNYAIGFQGSSSAFLQYNSFEDIIFIGCVSGFRNTHSPRTTSFGLENNVAWNTFKSVKSQQASLNYVVDLFDFRTGSGTGNDFNDVTARLDNNGSLFNFSGDGCVVGDLTFYGCRGSTPNGGQASLITVGDNTVYRRNVVFTSCQADANITRPFNLSQVGSVKYREWKWFGSLGGGTALDSALGLTNGFLIEGRNVSRLSSGFFKESLATGTVVTSAFRLTLGAFSGGVLEVKASGLIQGQGFRIFDVKYHVTSSATLAAVRVIETQETPAAQNVLTVSTVVEGMDIVVNVTTVSSSSGSNIDVQAVLSGQGLRINDLR